MTDYLKQAYAADIKVRTEGAEGLSREGLTVNVHEIAAPGLIYKDANRDGASYRSQARDMGTGLRVRDRRRGTYDCHFR